MRCALVSMDSTIRSSATVGPPIELLFLQRDQLDAPARYKSFERNDDYLVKLRSAWKGTSSKEIFWPISVRAARIPDKT